MEIKDSTDTHEAFILTAALISNYPIKVQNKNKLSSPLRQLSASIYLQMVIKFYFMNETGPS